MELTIEKLIPAVPGWWVVSKDNVEEAPVAAFAMTEWNGRREVEPMIPSDRGTLSLASDLFPRRKLDLIYDPTRG